MGKIINNDLNIVQQTVKIGAGSPKPHSISLPLYGLKILNLLKRENKELEELFIKHSLQQLDVQESRLWGVPDINSMAISCLEQVSWPEDIKIEKETKLSHFKKALLNLATVDDIGTHYDGRVATTAFICLDLSNTLLIKKDDELRNLVLNARRWLLHRQKGNRFWCVSNTEKKRAVKSKEYYTAVALRGIISTFRLEDYDISSTIWCKIANFYKKRAKVSYVIV